MVECSSCGKPVGVFSVRHKLEDGSILCGDCLDKWEKGQLKGKIIKNSESRKQGEIKEIKCKCSECGKVWHYLESEEKHLRTQAVGNAMVGCGMCCNPFGALFSNKAQDLSREANKFSKCPKCGSGNITKTEIYYDKEA